MEDKNFEILEQVLEINEEEAKLALELSDDNLEQAFKMADYIDKSYMIIHGKFKLGDYYGLLNIVADGKNGKIIRTDSVSANEKDIMDINLRVSNKVFLKTLEIILEEFDRQDDYESQRIKEEIEGDFKPVEIFELLELLKEGKEEEFQKFFKEKLENIKLEEINLEIHGKVTNKFKLKDAYPELFKEEIESIEEIVNNQEGDKELESGDKKLGLDIKLHCNPIISPTKGKKISDMEIGDLIAVDIIDQREVGQYLKDLLQSTYQEVLGEVQEISFSNNSARYKILVQFGPNIYGKLVVDPGVKIKFSKVDDIAKVKNSENVIIIEQSTFIIVLLIVITVILLIIIAQFLL